MRNKASRIVICALLAFVMLLGICGINAKIANAKQLLPDGENPLYATAYNSLKEARLAGNELNNRIADEGMVLMKNEDAALPLSTGEKNVTFFGQRSVNIQTGGSGSGEGVVDATEVVTLIQAMKNYGFNVNPTMENFYKSKPNGDGQPEIAISEYTAEVESSYSDYGDVAFIIVSRRGREGSDMPMGSGGDSKHDLEMTDEENALLEYVTSRPEFKKIVFLVNTGNVIEMSQYIDNPKVDAVIYTGYTGTNGISALPRILTGEVNPSGHTVDVWPANFRQDPTWFNFSYNTQAGGTTINEGTGPDGKPLTDVGIVRSMDYEENVYYGYKWYETAAIIPGYYNTEEQYKDPAHPDDAYYNRYNGVIYPFGYGLSYTTFEWEVGELSLAEEITEAHAANEVTVDVTVTNTGDVAGKELVQIYLRAPYDDLKGIEKSDVSLLAFQKTDVIQPGKSQTVTLKFNVRDLAHFDWNDINGNEFKGYEIEPGEYELLFRTDSHTDKNENDSRFLNVCADGVKYSEDGIDNPLNYNMGYGTETAKPWFSMDNEYNVSRVGTIGNGERVNTSAEGDAKYITRRAWRTPDVTKAGDPELQFSDKAVDVIFSQIYYASALDREDDPWYKTAEDIPGYGQTNVPGGWKQAPAGTSSKAAIQLNEMAGVPIDDPKWVEFMNQLTWKEMTMLVSRHAYMSYGVSRIGKPQSIEADGPAQLERGGKAGTFWCSPTVIASTYNLELAYKVGRQVGDESFLTQFTAWYAPGVNIHRGPFGGRNFEYYSQDGLHSGMFAAAVVNGATSKGLQVYVKHFAVNDMDTDRNTNGGISMWITEQAMRETYLKPFEYAVKYGNATGMMSTHGKVGLYATQNNYYLLNQVPQNEWGFQGNLITDLVGSAPVNEGRSAATTGDMLIRSGNMYLGNPNHENVEANRTCNGRVIEGYYDAAQNKVFVPETFTITNWVGSYNSNPNAGSYTATVQAGAFTMESPTQWYWLRTTCQRFLFSTANSNAMALVSGSYSIGKYVGIHFNDGVTDDVEMVVKSGTVIEKPQDPVVGVRERFAGWYTDVACTVPADFSQPITSATHFYALITESDAYYVTYNLNYDGAPTSENIVVGKGQAVTLPPYEPHRNGFTFTGWYADAECNTAVDLRTEVANEDKIYYAGWLAVPTYTVTFDLNYEGIHFPVVENVEIGLSVSEPAFNPTREGYRFDGWYRDSRCTAKYDFSSAVTQDTTLYAKWTQVKFVTDDENNDGGCSGYLGNTLIPVAVIAFALICAFIIMKKLKNK